MVAITLGSLLMSIKEYIGDFKMIDVMITDDRSNRKREMAKCHFKEVALATSFR